MHASWDAEGIARDLVFTVDDAVPGLYIIDVDDSGERNFTYWRSASPARRWLDILLREGGAARLAGADLIYFSGISLAILPEAQRSAALQLLSTAQQRGARIAFDPNYRRALWASSTVARETLGAAIRLADIVLPSEEDLTSAGLVKSAHRELVITYGSRGCSILVDGAQRLLDAPVVAANDVVDTSGAGDSFNGTYLAARLMDADPSTAATAALAVAARVVTASGAIVPREVSHPTR
jgi:2-dehydro-3-deoxygluconokinase